MTVIQVDIIPSKKAETTQTTQYNSTETTIIDKFTATNAGLAHATFSINIVPSDGVVSNSNLILNKVTIEPGATYTCPEVVGHIITTGGFISTISSSFSEIIIRASGRKISIPV